MLAPKLEFAKRVLLPVRVDEYVYKLVREYTELLNYKVTLRSDAERMSVTLLREDDPSPTCGALRAALRRTRFFRRVFVVCDSVEC